MPGRERPVRIKKKPGVPAEPRGRETASRQGGAFAEDARFLATITVDANGKPEVSHNPPLSTEEEAKREYRILGKRTLAPSEDWTDVTDIPDLDAAGYRFFKVTVKMRE